MAFGIRCNFNRIQSYAQAAHVWKNKAVIFPADRKHDNPLAPRGLVDKRKKHMTIERTEAGDIILRLYQHPTVTWHQDNSVTLCSYNSRSTIMFANHCTPPSMYVGGGSNSCFRVSVDGRTYRVPDQITFRERDNTWKADEITPWSIPVVNRERAKQALEDTGYKEFRLWLIVYLQMASPPREYAWADDTKIVSMVRDRKWRELVACFRDRSVDTVLNNVRQAIYRTHDCIEQKSVPFLG